MDSASSSGARAPSAPSALSAAIAVVGADHVRLSYEYLDRGDLDGYGSVLADDIELRSPGGVVIRGRSVVERAHLPRGRHVVHDVFGAGRRVTAIGRFIGEYARQRRVDVEFADVYTLSDNGLLLTQATYYFTPPV